VGGLRHVVDRDWVASTRVVIHIADAPCHGSVYHDGLGDNYPNGDPSGESPEKYLTMLRNKRTHYFFIEINSYTRTMTEKFSKVWNLQDVGSFQVRSLGDNPGELLPAVVESVKASIKAEVGAPLLPGF